MTKEFSFLVVFPDVSSSGSPGTPFVPSVMDSKLTVLFAFVNSPVNPSSRWLASRGLDDLLSRAFGSFFYLRFLFLCNDSLGSTFFPFNGGVITDFSLWKTNVNSY